MKKILLALAAVLALTSCAETSLQSYYRLETTTVHIPDGRSVLCITSDVGIDCDWDNAR